MLIGMIAIERKSEHGNRRYVVIGLRMRTKTRARVDDLLRHKDKRD
jgi:hypothetical protein